MEDEDLLQSLKQVEAMADGELDIDNMSAGEMPLEGEDEDTDSEFLNEYESAFNFIDSELDALRSSIVDVQPSLSLDEQDKKMKEDADDSSYSSSSEKSPFQMPDNIEEMALKMGLESESEPESEGEEEMEARLMEASEEYKIMEQETEPSFVEIMESTEEQESSSLQVDPSPQEPPAQSAVEKLEQDTIKQQPLEEPSPLPELETKLEEEAPQVQLEPLPRAAPPTQHQLDKKPSSQQSFRFLTTLISIALAFLTGQRFPKQDRCHSLETAGTMSLLKPHEFQTIELHLNSNFEDVPSVEDDNDYNNFEEVLFLDNGYCEREVDFSPLFTTIDTTSMEVEKSEPQEVNFQNHTEAIERLSTGDKAAHAAAIHEALEEQEEQVKSDEFDFDKMEFYFEDTLDMEVVSSYQPMGVLVEETSAVFEFGEISAADWATPKLLEMMMQNENMETVYVMYEEPQPLYADQSINLQFGVTEYEGFIISMEMMQFVEPLCRMPLLLH